MNFFFDLARFSSSTVLPDVLSVDLSPPLAVKHYCKQEEKPIAPVNMRGARGTRRLAISSVEIVCSQYERSRLGLQQIEEAEAEV